MKFFSSEMAESSEEIKHACGVFGCVAAGVWPTQLDVANILCLGLVAIQHRYGTRAFIFVLLYNVR